MAGHLIGGAEMRFGAAKARRDQDDSHVFDRRKREHPLEIANLDQEQCGNAD